MNALPISRLVNVSVNLSPIAAQMQNLSTLLILGSSSIIDVVERIRNYSTIAEVAADFGTSAPEYLAAVLWFEQSPQPTTLSIGRWAKTAPAGRLVGGLLSSAQQAIALWNAVTTGAFEVEVDEVPISINSLNFSAATNLNGIATIIQVALAAKSAGCTVVWDSNYSRFVVQSGTTGAASSVKFLNAPTATGDFIFAGQPANNDTITLNGTVVTFVTAPATGKVTIGGTVTETLANLLAFLNASTDAQLVKFIYYVAIGSLYVKAATPGAGGDALTIAKSSVNITVSGATLVGGTGTDVSTMLGCASSSSGAYVADGIAAETPLEAVTLMDDTFGQSWYALTVLGATNNDHLDVSSYISAANNKHLYGVSTQEAGVLSALSTTDIASLLKAVGSSRTVTQYSSSNAYSVCSLLGRILTVNYNGNNTTITLMYKQEPGIVAETVTSTQINALEAKNCNIFVAYNNDTAIIENGKVASGDFLDTTTGTDWLALQIQNNVFNLLYTSTTKIPQTDAGVQLITTSIEAVCSQGVTNGLLAPGVWNSGGFGELVQGDFLPKGFYVYAQPVSLQFQADREARKSPPIQVAAKLAGAIHTVDVIVNVNR